MTKKRISHEQGSEEWQKYRAARLGCSELAAIMGRSPYKTAFQVWEEKKTIKTDYYNYNFAQSRGLAYEPIARRLFENTVDANFPPAVFEHPVIPYFSASMDGFNETKNEGVEIKFQGKDAHEATCVGEKIPEHYMIQIQGQLLVTGADRIAFVSYNPEGRPDTFVSHWVEADKDLQKEIMTAVIDWGRRMEENDPPEFTDRDVRDLTEYKSEVGVLFEEFEELKEKEAELVEKMDLVKCKIFEFMKTKNIPCGQLGKVRVRKLVKAGAVDYKKIPELKGVDLSKYRKKNTEYYTILKLKEVEDGKESTN